MMSNQPAYRLSDHAEEEAKRRNIPLNVIEMVITSPEQVIKRGNDRRIYQSRTEINGKLYLIRVVIELTKPLTVVTVYRTSKIEKYWSDDHESDL